MNMAATIRLTRVGKKHTAIYRIVVMDKRKPRDGRYIEALGSYNPLAKEDQLVIDDAKFDAWTAKGAQISEGIRKLLKNRKVSSKN